MGSFLFHSQYAGPLRPMAAFWSRLSVVAGALLAHTGCAAPREATAPGVLNITEGQSASFIRNFNPLQFAGDVRWPARHAMYEPLIIYNPMTGLYVPWLAESHRWSEDRL